LPSDKESTANSMDEEVDVVSTKSGALDTDRTAFMLSASSHEESSEATVSESEQEPKTPKDVTRKKVS
jgi:hypothetical protein